MKPGFLTENEFLVYGVRCEGYVTHYPNLVLLEMVEVAEEPSVTFEHVEVYKFDKVRYFSSLLRRTVGYKLSFILRRAEGMVHRDSLTFTAKFRDMYGNDIFMENVTMPLYNAMLKIKPVKGLYASSRKSKELIHYRAAAEQAVFELTMEGEAPPENSSISISGNETYSVDVEKFKPIPAEIKVEPLSLTHSMVYVKFKNLSWSMNRNLSTIELVATVSTHPQFLIAPVTSQRIEIRNRAHANKRKFGDDEDYMTRRKVSDEEDDDEEEEEDDDDLQSVSSTEFNKFVEPLSPVETSIVSSFLSLAATAPPLTFFPHPIICPGPTEALAFIVFAPDGKLNSLVMISKNAEPPKDIDFSNFFDKLLPVENPKLTAKFPHTPFAFYDHKARTLSFYPSDKKTKEENIRAGSCFSLSTIDAANIPPKFIFDIDIYLAKCKYFDSLMKIETKRVAMRVDDPIRNIVDHWLRGPLN